LQRLFGDEGALQRVWIIGASQSLDGDDILVLDGAQGCVSGGHGPFADHDMASAAFAGSAPEMWADQAEPAAEDRKQRCIGIGIDIGFLAVQTESNAH